MRHCRDVAVAMAGSIVFAVAISVSATGTEKFNASAVLTATMTNGKIMNEEQLQIIYKFLDLTNWRFEEQVRLEQEAKLRLDMLRQFKTEVEMLCDDLRKAGNTS